MRHNVLVRLMPDRSTLYRMGDDGRIYNKFRLDVANRGSEAASVALKLEGLPDAVIALRPNPLKIEPGQQLQEQFEIAVGRFAAAQDVNHFRLRAQVDPEGTEQIFDMTFLMPPEKRTR